MSALQAVALNGIFLAFTAHVLIGISLIWDKVLLKRRETQNLLSYLFWLGAISIFGLLLMPFGFHVPSLKLATLAFVAGLLDLIASYFYYSALKSGEASDQLAAMGGFAPVATALIAIPLLKAPIDGELSAFLLLTAGGFLMFFADKAPLRTMLPKLILAAAGFGLMNVLQKLVFDQTNFVSGYVFFTLGTFAGSLTLLIPPAWRRQIFQTSANAEPSSKFWYMFNRFLAGVGSFLVVFAVSRANPSLVQAIAGVRYVTIFVGAYLMTRLKPSWFREDFTRWPLLVKSTATALVIAGLVLLGIHGGGERAAHNNRCQFSKVRVELKQPDRPELMLGVSRAALYRLLLLVCALLLIVYARHIIVVAFAGVLLAISLRGFTTQLERLPFISPRWSYPLGLLILVAVAAAAGYTLGPRIGAQARQVVSVMPRSVKNMQNVLGQYEPTRELMRLVGHSMQSQQAGTLASTLATASVQLLIDGIAVAVIAIFLANNPQLYLQGILYLLPRGHRARTASLATASASVARRWLLGQLIPMTALGLGTVIGLWFLDIPLAFALGLFTCCMLFVPYAGAVIAFIPTTLIAFTVSPAAVLHVIILFLAIHFAEGYVISPIAQRHVIHLPPALTLVSQLFMWKIAGILGVLIATPLAAVMMLIIQKLHTQSEQQQIPALPT